MLFRSIRVNRFLLCSYLNDLDEEYLSAFSGSVSRQIKKHCCPYVQCMHRLYPMKSTKFRRSGCVSLSKLQVGYTDSNVLNGGVLLVELRPLV